MLQDWINAINLFIHPELGRIMATLVVIIVTMILMKLLQRRARYTTGARTEMARRRGNFVLIKNLVLFTSVIVIITIWASKIAGAALSLAAVAGAILIVSKEFWLNLLGTAALTISRLYRVGDFIELDGISGRVIDTDLLSTTLSETQDGNHLTSRTVTLPHSLLLVKPVRNLTATGEFVVNLLRIGLDPAEDLMAHEKILLETAREICQPWIAQADAHLQRIESRELMDLPSAEPRVIIQLNSSKEATLSLRYACRPIDKAKVEQKILRQYLIQCEARKKGALELK